MPAILVNPISYNPLAIPKKLLLDQPVKQKTIITIPFQLALDTRLTSAAKAVYLVLKSFQISNQKLILSHREIMNRSKLSHLTATKALKNLEETGWISVKRNSGSPNTYSFLLPPVF